ncbi:MAG: carboxylesterase family protein [Thermoleophilia bacterium]|nr:carboxylesterase family protein [Thermoleophilia bacterium]
MGRRAIVAVLVAAVMLLVGCSETEESSPAPSPGVVRVAGGLISGSELDDVRVYLGIPFAAPPVGELRWRAPQAPQPWDGVRACDAYGPSCPQPGAAGFNLLPVGETDEDCLYLNVWAPSAAVAQSGGDGGSNEASALPVMVWIHGGSFATGSGSQTMYEGTNLARLGAVVVTINYRLGPLGFLAHPELSAEDPSGASGNYGLLDQIAALEWVRDNIAAFGGDPGNVTVFGESAGGMSVCDLMVSPAAEGLFARGMVQSGPFDSQAAGMDAVLPLAEAEENGRELSRQLGCDEAPDELAALRDVPVDRLVAAGGQTMSLGPGGLGFVPVVDGVVLPDDPAVLFAAGELHDVDLLVGANADEANLFLLGMPGQSVGQLTEFVRQIYEPYDDEVLALFPDEVYGSRRAALSKAVTVMGFVASARFAAASVAEAGGDAYLYHFTRRSPFTLGLGAFHSVEIPYVFGNSMLMLDVSRGVDGELSQAMMRYWVSFARDGDPNGPVPADGDAVAVEQPSWPVYDPSADLCLFLDSDIEAGPAPYAEACDLADRLRAERVGEPLP